MLQARQTLGVCFVSQPYFVPLFWLCLVHVRSAVEFPSHASSANSSLDGYVCVCVASWPSYVAYFEVTK